MYIFLKYIIFVYVYIILNLFLLVQKGLQFNEKQVNLRKIYGR